MADVKNIRDEYHFSGLGKSNVNNDPIRQFEEWFNEALAEEIPYPNAMNLTTCGKDMKPTSRMVLLKGFDKDGFIFYTNLNSRKSTQIKQNRNVSLLFFWDKLGRQIRIEGQISDVTNEMAEDYFASRPLRSRVSAIISPQSEHIPNRQYLEEKYEKLLKEDESKLKKPEHWGGYRVNPDYFEFWQGREDRMHDRISYTRETQNWIIERLAP